MTLKRIIIVAVVLLLVGIAVFAQGRSRRFFDNNTGQHCRSYTSVPISRQGGRHGMGGNGIVGEIQNIDTTKNSFEIQGRNNAIVTVYTDAETTLVYADDLQDILDDEDFRGRQRDLLDDIDTSGMSDAEIRQALFDANEERIAETEKKIEAIAIDFSKLEEDDDVRVQMSPSGDNVARLIIVD